MNVLGGDRFKKEQQVETDQADPRLYIKLATSVRAQIQTGELTPGLRVPPIASLRQATGYSRQTCSKALQMLEREGLLRRIPGLGYHVAIDTGSAHGGQPSAVADQQAHRLPII